MLRISRPAVSGSGESKMKRRYPALSCQLQKSSTKWPGSSATARNLGARAQVREILIDAGAQHGDFLRPKQLPEAHGAVALKALDDVGVNHADSGTMISSSRAGPR